MFNRFSNISQPRINGLQTIDADTINSESIDTIELTVNGVDILNQVETNTSNIQVLQ